MEKRRANEGSNDCPAIPETAGIIVIAVISTHTVRTISMAL